jgi:choline kinase
VITKSAILPAAGSATRMRGLPKFMLPCSQDYETLLERHINYLLPLVDTIWIPTRPEYAHLIVRLGFGSKIIVHALETETMSETVIKVANVAKADRFILCMPDTYFHGELPYDKLSSSQSSVELSMFEIRDDQKGKLGQILLDDNGTVVDAVDKNLECDYKYAWGALSFTDDFVKLLDEKEPHVGYAIPRAIDTLDISGSIIDSEYFDCGTPKEYLRMLKTVWD